MFAGVKAGSRLEQEEIFGPVLSVVRVNSFDEAVRVNNGVSYGLSSCVYTRRREPRLPRDAGARQRHHLRQRAHHRRRGAPAVRRRQGRPGNGHREGGWEVYEFYSETKVCYVDYSGRLQRAQIDNYDVDASRSQCADYRRSGSLSRLRKVGSRRVRVRLKLHLPLSPRVEVLACAQCRSVPASEAPSFDEGSLDQYLREISKYPLIPQEEEVRLAQRIRVGDAEALDKLVRSNLRFVVSVAKKYQNQGVSLADLINEGNLGLIRAAHKFDETKGIKFISYAVWWIRQAILQALAEQSRIVRVPLNRAGTLHRIGKRSSALLQELGREPTPVGDRRGDGHRHGGGAEDPLHLAEPPLARCADHPGRRQPPARLPARHPESRSRRRDLRARADRVASRRCCRR